MLHPEEAAQPRGIHPGGEPPIPTHHEDQQQAGVSGCSRQPDPASTTPTTPASTGGGMAATTAGGPEARPDATAPHDVMDALADLGIVEEDTIISSTLAEADSLLAMLGPTPGGPSMTASPAQHPHQPALGDLLDQSLFPDLDLGDGGNGSGSGSADPTPAPAVLDPKPSSEAAVAAPSSPAVEVEAQPVANGIHPKPALGGLLPTPAPSSSPAAAADKEPRDPHPRKRQRSASPPPPARTAETAATPKAGDKRPASALDGDGDGDGDETAPSAKAGEGSPALNGHTTKRARVEPAEAAAAAEAMATAADSSAPELDGPPTAAQDSAPPAADQAQLADITTTTTITAAVEQPATDAAPSPPDVPIEELESTAGSSAPTPAPPCEAAAAAPKLEMKIVVSDYDAPTEPTSTSAPAPATPAPTPTSEPTAPVPSADATPTATATTAPIKSETDAVAEIKPAVLPVPSNPPALQPKVEAAEAETVPAAPMETKTANAETTTPAAAAAPTPTPATAPGSEAAASNAATLPAKQGPSPSKTNKARVNNKAKAKAAAAEGPKLDPFQAGCLALQPQFDTEVLQLMAEYRTLMERTIGHENDAHKTTQYSSDDVTMALMWSMEDAKERVSLEFVRSNARYLDEFNRGRAEARRKHAQLIEACNATKLDKVLELLEDNVEVNTLTFDKKTALYQACASGNERLAEMLLEHGADPNLPCGDLEVPALHVAANNNHAKIIRLLIRSGADRNQANAENNTAFDLNITVRAWSALKNTPGPEGLAGRAAEVFFEHQHKEREKQLNQEEAEAQARREAATLKRKRRADTARAEQERVAAAAAATPIPEPATASATASAAAVAAAASLAALAQAPLPSAGPLPVPARAGASEPGSQPKAVAPSPATPTLLAPGAASSGTQPVVPAPAPPAEQAAEAGPPAPNSKAAPASVAPAPMADGDPTKPKPAPPAPASSAAPGSKPAPETGAGAGTGTAGAGPATPQANSLAPRASAPAKAKAPKSPKTASPAPDKAKRKVPRVQLPRSVVCFWPARLCPPELPVHAHLALSFSTSTEFFLGSHANEALLLEHKGKLWGKHRTIFRHTCGRNEKLYLQTRFEEAKTPGFRATLVLTSDIHKLVKSHAKYLNSPEIQENVSNLTAFTLDAETLACVREKASKTVENHQNKAAAQAAKGTLPGTPGTDTPGESPYASPTKEHDGLTDADGHSGPSTPVASDKGKDRAWDVDVLQSGGGGQTNGVHPTNDAGSSMDTGADRHHPQFAAGATLPMLLDCPLPPLELNGFHGCDVAPAEAEAVPSRLGVATPSNGLTALGAPADHNGDHNGDAPTAGDTGGGEQRPMPARRKPRAPKAVVTSSHDTPASSKLDLLASLALESGDAVPTPVNA